MKNILEVNFERTKQAFERRRVQVSKNIDFRREIKFFFSEKMQSTNDFVVLVNAVNKVIYGEKSQPLEIKHFYYHAYHNKKRYRYFQIKKKKGGFRGIHAPQGGLKHILRTINFILQTVYKPHSTAHGFVLNRSVVSNANKHIGQNYVFNIDLKDFFHTIHKPRIEKRLQLPPFNLNNEKKEIATLISRLATEKFYVYTPFDSNLETYVLTESVYRQLQLGWLTRLPEGEITNSYAVLPQGAPTSPFLSNAVCERLDRKLFNLAKKHNVKYTRYADDMTFSSMHNVYTDNSDFLSNVYQIIREEGFEINQEKTRLQKRGYRQEVTGLTVNEKVNVSRKYIKHLRTLIYLIEQFGIEKAQEIFSKQDKSASKGARNQVSNIQKVISGKLNYMKMVKGEQDATYSKLMEKFSKALECGPRIARDVSLEDTSGSTLNLLNIGHSPKKLRSILEKFALGDNPLKYTTHAWDSGQPYEYSRFIANVKKEWIHIDSELADTSKRLKAKIYRFLLDNENNPWGRYEVPYGWSSPQVKRWFAENGNRIDDFRKLPISVTLKSGYEIETFSDVVDLFKREIKFYPSGNNFRKFILEKAYNVELEDFDEESYEILDDAEFFTNTEWVSLAFNDIFQFISDRSKENGKKVRIVANEIENTEDPMIEIRIVHLNSQPERRATSIIKKIDKRQGSLSGLVDRIVSVCDFSLEGSFPDGNYRLNILGEDGGIEPIDYKPDGFTFVLRFHI